MLSAEFGGLRPWEMSSLTPDEERRLHVYRRALERQAQEV